MKNENAWSIFIFDLSTMTNENAWSIFIFDLSTMTPVIYTQVLFSCSDFYKWYLFKAFTEKQLQLYSGKY